EVEAAGRDIRARLERGALPERIAFLARDLDVYGDLIEDVCRRYRIPVYFRKGRPLLGSGLVRACLDVVRCVTDGFPRARLETLRGLDGPRTPAGHVRALRRVLRDLGFRPVPRGALVPATVRRDVRALEGLEEALDQVAGLARTLGMAPIPLAGLLRLLVAVLEPLQVEDPAERTGSVRALSVLDARGLDFDAVYLLGLDDGTFPAPRG